MIKHPFRSRASWATVFLGSAFLLAGCGTSAGSHQAAAAASNTPPLRIPDQTLVAKAKAEGMVHGFGMPSNWANLGNMWSSFSQTYGIKTSYAAEGNMTSGQELAAFAAERAHPVGDVGDVGLSFGPLATQKGLVAAFENRYWNQIPANLKDPSGHWAAAYYGVIAFEVNTDKVKQIPHTWADLLKPAYRGMIGLDDPRQAGVAFDAVVAASYANGGSLNNLAPGLQYFAKLYRSGNWTGVGGDSSQVKSGQAAIAITWNYLGQSDQQEFAGHPHIQVVVPSDATVAGPYVEVINRLAPHPYAARLLNTYLFSDAGQISYAKGGAYPVRLPYLHLPSGVTLPPLNTATVHFLTGDESQAQAYVLKNWGPTVLSQ